jgi:hypothetical protein
VPRPISTLSDEEYREIASLAAHAARLRARARERQSDDRRFFDEIFAAIRSMKPSPRMARVLRDLMLEWAEHARETVGLLIEIDRVLDTAHAEVATDLHVDLVELRDATIEIANRREKGSSVAARAVLVVAELAKDNGNKAADLMNCDTEELPDRFDALRRRAERLEREAERKRAPNPELEEPQLGRTLKQLGDEAERMLRALERPPLPAPPDGFRTPRR